MKVVSMRNCFAQTSKPTDYLVTSLSIYNIKISRENSKTTISKRPQTNWLIFRSYSILLLNLHCIYIYVTLHFKDLRFTCRQFYWMFPLPWKIRIWKKKQLPSPRMSYQWSWQNTLRTNACPRAHNPVNCDQTMWKKYVRNIYTWGWLLEQSVQSLQMGFAQETLLQPKPKPRLWLPLYTPIKLSWVWV